MEFETEHTTEEEAFEAASRRIKDNTCVTISYNGIITAIYFQPEQQWLVQIVLNLVRKTIPTIVNPSDITNTYIVTGDCR